MQKAMPFSPGAPAFSPDSTQGYQQVHSSAKNMDPSPCLEARVLSLELQQQDTRGDIHLLTEKYEKLFASLDTLKNDDRSVRSRIFCEEEPTKSIQAAAQFEAELDKLSEIREALHVNDDVERLSPAQASGSEPTYIGASSVASCGIVTKSLPPHRHTSKATLNDRAGRESSATPLQNSPLITDGPSDPQVISAPALTPPASPKPSLQVDRLSIAHLAPKSTWMPLYISSLQPLSDHDLLNVPSGSMVTFSPDFINTLLKGESWSPGMYFSIGPKPYVLRNRTYYVLDPKTEPFLPVAPGDHGAKLAAFFKSSPEEFHEFDDDVSSSQDVPLFVETMDANGKLRYAYYGNYSQTRWSDKLDYDTMMTQVPADVKEFWAEELTSTAREDWVTDALKNHFFPKPEYKGCLFATPGNGDNDSSVATEVEAECNKNMDRDVSKYVQELRDWDREAKMKTAMIKKDFILSAFQTPDVDELPALRLYWEYLECVSWRKDFYDFMVTLQSRNPDYLN